MANQFYVPWAIIRDVAGIGIPGAQILFTQTGTNTKKSVYHDAGLTTPHTNPVICDGVGNPPIIYMDPIVSYRVRLYDRDAEAGVDTPISGGDIDPYVPGIFADATALQPVADDAANSASAATNSAAVAAAAVATVEGIVASANDMNVQAQAAVTSIAAALGPSVLTLSQLVASGMPLNASWFGTLGSNSAANFNAITAAIAESEGLATTGYGYSNGGPPVYVPYNELFISEPLEVAHSLRLYGDYNGGDGGGGTVIAADGAFTILIAMPGCAGASVEGFFFKGVYTNSESEAHGVDLRDKMAVRRNFFDYIPGDGVHGDTFTLGTNVNDVEVSGNFFQRCRTGLYMRGSDANALKIDDNRYFLNRRYGRWFKDTIGECLITDRDYSTNGVDPLHPTMCVYDGGSGVKWYYVLPDQDAWAKANPPSGTSANNTGWGYLDAVVAASPEHPTWANTINFRSGGVSRDEGGSNFQTIVGGYQEGDQPPASSNGNVTCVNFPTRGFDGSPNVNFDNNAGKARVTGNSGVQLIGNTEIQAPAVNVGQITDPGIDYDTEFRINGWSTNPTITMYNNGVRYAVIGYQGIGDWFEILSAKFRWKNADGSTIWAELDASGNYNLKVGAYYVNGTQVVSARQTGWTADTGTAKKTANATYSGTAEAAYTQATIQALMNAVRDISQTQKALKDAAITHGLIGT